ncbi:MAG: 2'-5' RNA ligase family protein, partial [Stellaceae bacterium]
IVVFAGNGAAAKEAGHDRLVAIDILLRPDATMVRQAKALNRRLRKESPVGFALDATHVPHITLLQCYVREADLGAVRRDVEGVFRHAALTDMRLTATGYFNGPVGPVNATGIVVATSNQLASLHRHIVDAVTPFVRHGGTAAAFVGMPRSATIGWTVVYVDKFLANSSGPKFGPHVTVGAGSAKAVAGLVAEPFMPFSFAIVGGGIYQLGDIGTARKRLWIQHP